MLTLQHYVGDASPRAVHACMSAMRRAATQHEETSWVSAHLHAVRDVTIQKFRTFIPLLFVVIRG
jgi:hypothetical protein